MGRGAGGGGFGPGGSPTVRFIVRFVSAMPLRHAMARARFGDQVGTSPEASKMLSIPDPFYVVAISGLRRPPKDLEAVKQASSLRAKGKEPFLPVQARMENGMLVLVFPREGHPFTVEDREVEVQVRLPEMKDPIRRSFKLKDMVYQGKLEL